MVFRDQRLVCQECGKTFFFTVTEQRRLAEQVGEENMEAPDLCSACRHSISSSAPASVQVQEPAEPAKQARSAGGSPAVERVQRTEHVEPRHRAKDAPVIEVDDFPLQEEGIELKLIGEVKWFNRRKGYGFVTMADGEEVFFHRSDVAGGQLSQVKDGIQVEFQVRRTAKGMEAFNVSILPPH